MNSSSFSGTYAIECGALNPLIALQMPAGLQIEELEGVVFLGGDNQPVPLEIIGKMIEVSIDSGKLNRGLQRKRLPRLGNGKLRDGKKERHCK